MDKGEGVPRFRTTADKGVQNMAKIADVICEWPLGNSQISFRKDGLETGESSRINPKHAFLAFSLDSA